MPNPNDFDDNYQPVAVRIQIFREKHPEGSLRPLDPANPFRVVHVNGQDYISMVAAAYRTPNDPAPGVGSAWFPVPSNDDYTFNVELQRCETAAWGRAIVATLAADATKIASVEEVQIAQASRRSSEKAPAAPKAAQKRPAPEQQPKANPAHTVPQEQAPPVTDESNGEYNRALIEQVMEALASADTTYDDLRDLYTVLSQANLLAWRVEPLNGVAPDGDGLTTIGTVISTIGRELKAASA